MTEPRVSVVVVSYDRPDDLELCLKALALQYRRNFEIIVVHNSGSTAGLQNSGLANEVKSAPFEAANISAARNLGINMSSGDIVAFIDDDAVAEPTWLHTLIEPFFDDTVMAAGGFVIGRNGFDLQWGSELVNELGEATQFDLSGTEVIDPKSGAYAKTHGTNCAFRREILVAEGGFDENYRFFLDETDLNIRLGKQGYRVAIAPEAEVHHKFSQSLYRRKSRAPKSLFEIGASTAYFLKKHAQPMDHLNSIRRSQRYRLQSMVVAGHLEPRDVERLIHSFDEGVSEGKGRLGRGPMVAKKPDREFLEFRPYSAPTSAKYLSCRRVNSSGSKDQAKRLAMQNEVVTLMIFSWTSWRHRRWFHRDGYWVQSGGLFGKSDRDQKPFQLFSLASRTRAEISSLTKKRGPVMPI